MQTRKKILGKISAAFLLALLILLFFWTFLSANSERIISQNSDYISDTAAQKSKRIEIIFHDAQKNINILSYLYGQNLKHSNVDAAELKKMTAGSTFDQIEFADKNGKNVDESGVSTDISDRDYFQKAMRGESSMDAVFDSQSTEGGRILFASPLRIDGKITGVLTGFFQTEHMIDFIYSSYFGNQTPTYLCDREGQIIAGASDEQPLPKNIVTYFDTNGNMSRRDLIEFRNSLAHGHSSGFRYDASAGHGIIYVTNIIDSDFMLVQAFPAEVTQRMIRNADSAGVILTVELLVVLFLYIAVILLMDRRQRKKILQQNAEMSFVIEGTTKLFDRFILVDLNQKIYRYLAGTYQPIAIPPRGEYSQLVDFLASMAANEEDREKIAGKLEPDIIQQKLGATNPRLNYELYLQRGHKLWESLNIVCLARNDGVASLVLFTRQDVTESKMIELQKNAALRDALEAATAANQAKSDFLSHMSHDIRTPMNAIMGMTSIAAMHTDDPEKIKDCLNKITISSRHLLGLINEVLDMSKIESNKMPLVKEEFNIPELLDNLLSIFHSQTEKKNQHLSVDSLNIKHEQVIGDAQRLQQVFVNILGNAVKFTPEGGNISISIKELPSKKDMDDSLYEFTFTDSGIGMEKDFIDHLFEPFSRATDSRTSRTEGSGLGMSIANNIIQMMDGHIRVKSTLGKGSEFTVSVCLEPCENDSEKLELLTGQTALVVDDEARDCESVCQILNRIGMVSDYTQDGNTAVTKLLDAKENGNPYTAVFLDWKLADRNGFQTVEEIRNKIGNNILIILLSSYDWIAVQPDTGNAEINAFIAKPLFKSRLLHVMKNLLDGQPKDSDSASSFTSQEYTGKKILLVEDNELNMEIAQEILQMAGFTVYTACDGAEAVKQVSESEEYFYDLILMDIQMPNMNGYEATSTIRTLARRDVKTLPIIAMSANAFADDIYDAKKAGMNDHVAKPIEIPKLAQTIHAYLK